MCYWKNTMIIYNRPPVTASQMKALKCKPSVQYSTVVSTNNTQSLHTPSLTARIIIITTQGVDIPQGERLSGIFSTMVVIITLFYKTSNCRFRLVQAVIGQWLATMVAVLTVIVHQVHSNYQMVNQYMYKITVPLELVHNANLWPGTSSWTLPSSLLISACWQGTTGSSHWGFVRTARAPYHTVKKSEHQ